MHFTGITQDIFMNTSAKAIIMGKFHFFISLEEETTTIVTFWRMATFFSKAPLGLYSFFVSGSKDLLKVYI